MTMNPAPTPASRAVTRVEVIDHIRTAFGTGPVTPADLVAAAGGNGARDEILDVLRRLPGDRKFTRPQDIWHDLADIPIDL